ncbi:MAG: cytochrome-c peroxidase [candidate division Zixibacteria bacterium]|nr:cytochrome-c peroxidase [candidate division Zixibacteria bacterium]
MPAPHFAGYRLLIAGATLPIAFVWTCDHPPAWERENPVLPLPAPPAGIITPLNDPLALNYPRRTAPPTPERVHLGRWLFHDRRLSADGKVSCASCHLAKHGYSNTERFPAGAYGRRGTRKTLPIANLAWSVYPHYFRDGRAESLEDQVVVALTAETEMGSTARHVEETVRRITAYRPYFETAFRSPEISIDRIAVAIADYERTLMSGDSRWDRWQRTAVEDTSALAMGHRLFFGKAGCHRCHLGQNFTDNRFHNEGIGWDTASAVFADEGRAVVTGTDAHRGYFRTPTLRDVARHPPYMHDGSLPTLRAVVEHYNRGGITNPYLSPELKPLYLTGAEIDALCHFLEALDGGNVRDTGPSAFPE